MSLLRALTLVVRRSLRQHAVSTTITALMAALAAGLVLSVFSIQAQTFAAFTGGAGGYDAVLGARGSQLQLVLNAVFHLETSPGNIPWSLYEELAEDDRVALAIPYTTGDNYEGFRIVGTTDAMFDALGHGDAARFEVEPGGRVFDPERGEAVVGSFAARRTGLAVGSTFHPSHGVAAHGAAAHQEEYVVTGVLEPTNTPADRVIWIPIEGIYRMGGHVLRGSGEAFEAHPHEEIPQAHKEVSAVMLKFRSPMAGFALDQEFNRERTDATLAFPFGRVMAEFFDKLGWADRVLRFIAYLVVVVSAGAILASLYNTINERRREIAILRSLGASPRLVFLAVVLESSAIAFVGAMLGFVVHAVLFLVAAAILRERTGVVLELWAFHPALVWTPLTMVSLGAIAGFIPAMKAYATDVASHLVPHS
ncbi:MAG: ABC transporter permease [Nannocystaceae bacterium]|nr:ABC transporter permease [bacterium]